MGRAFYEQAVRDYKKLEYLEFASLDNLFGRVVTEARVVLSNSPHTDPRCGGLPPGHPPLKQFLGVPISRRGEVVGMIAIANRPDGYTAAEQNKIEILCSATGVLHDSYRRHERERVLAQEHEEAERALASSDSQFRAVFDKAGIGMAISDLTGHIVRCNDALTQLLGYGPDELCGKQVQTFTHEDDVAASAQVFRDMAAGRCDRAQIEKRHRRKDGEIVWSRVTVSLARKADSTPEFLIGMIEDITEQKLSAERLARQQRQLAHVARLSTMGEMVAGISHEINQPLAAIVNYAGVCAGLVASEVPDRQVLAGIVSEIKTVSQRAGDIIKRLRSFVNRGSQAPSTVDLNQFLREACDMMMHEIKERAIRPQLVVNGDSQFVLVDRVQILQVAVNLIRNAIDAMRNVHTRERTLMMGTGAGTGGVEVYVTDNGVGLSAEAVQRAFDPFYSTKQDGMGMGLAISRTIIETHGGRLWAHSNPGEGATFRFTLPGNNGD